MNVVIDLSARKVHFVRENKAAKKPRQTHKLIAFAVAVCAGVVMSAEMQGGLRLTEMQSFAANAVFALSFYVLCQRRREPRQPVGVTAS
jgi:hypothetical protein